ncbi:hypothetical protein [Prevotella sp.]|nr:hypothetical protein [Prevotella sp.]
MEAKELKIQAPEGYEIDKENSTFECIRFKPIKKDITYEDMCNSLFKTGYYINNHGEIIYVRDYVDNVKVDKNNATNKEQLERILALNQLLNIAEYYNKRHPINEPKCLYSIMYYRSTCSYEVTKANNTYMHTLEVIFNSKEDAQAVIDNPNFREILDTIYKFINAL